MLYGRIPDLEQSTMSYLERLRDRIGAAIEGDPPEYVCRGCGAGFDGRWQVCPKCGSYSIRRREWESLR